MTKKYIKVKLKDLEDGLVDLKTNKNLKDKMAKHKLKFSETDDLVNKFIFYDRGEYRYFLVRIFDLHHKNRYEIPTMEEKLDIEDYLKKGKFKLVDELPEMEI